jgi:ribosomal protein L22
MSTSEPDKPKRPRRPRRKAAEAEGAPATEARRTSGSEGEAAASDASASGADATSAGTVDEIQPTPADVQAEEAAEDVVLEAEAEAEAEGEPEAEKPKPKAARRPRRRGAAEPEAEKPAAPAPTRRRVQREPGAPPPVVRAQAKYVRSSARKARLVCDHIRGKTVVEARAILAHTPRAVARDWTKLLESAIANAENNHELVGEDLYVMVVRADEGPTIKRFRPRAMGRATKIRKRTSHLTILLTPKE